MSHVYVFTPHTLHSVSVDLGCFSTPFILLPFVRATSLFAFLVSFSSHTLYIFFVPEPLWISFPHFFHPSSLSLVFLVVPPFFPPLFNYSQTANHNSTTEKHTQLVVPKGNTSLPFFPSTEAGLVHKHTNKHTGFSGPEQNRLSNTDLFDAVGVDGGLWLQDADRLCLLGALRHLPHLLSDEVVDTIQCLHCPLDQTHSLCRPCTHRHTDRSVPKPKLMAKLSLQAKT